MPSVQRLGRVALWWCIFGASSVFAAEKSVAQPVGSRRYPPVTNLDRVATLSKKQASVKVVQAIASPLQWPAGQVNHDRIATVSGAC